MGGRGSLGGRGPSGDRRLPKKRGGLLRKAALITTGAVLFRDTSGDIMVGVHVTASRYLDICTSTGFSGRKDGDQPASSPGNDQMDGEGWNGQSDQGRSESHEKVPSSGGGGVVGVSSVVKTVVPTMVTVAGTVVYQSSNYSYGWFFGGPQAYEVPSSGSRVIIGENGQELLIVTDNHVVESTPSTKVASMDSEIVDTVTKETDTGMGLATIFIPLDRIKTDTRSKISVAKLESSGDLKVKQGMIAIGNALGYGQSVTVEYVSALDREVRASNNATRTLLQTDAVINPDNSGGALLNVKGKVVGINVAKYLSIEVERTGYVVPVSKVQGIMSQLMNRKTTNPIEEAKRGYLGIQGTVVDEETASLFGMPRGVYIYEALGGGTTAESGLRDKDIITKMGGQPTKTMTELQGLLICCELGKGLELTVQAQEDRRHQERIVRIALKSMPQEERSSPTQ